MIVRKKVLNKVVKTCYLNGKKQEEQSFFDERGVLRHINNYQDGVLQGVSKVFGETGKLDCEIPYLDGKIHGVEKWFYLSGEIKKEVKYVRGKLTEVRGFLPDGKNTSRVFLKNKEWVEYSYNRGSLKEKCADGKITRQYAGTKALKKSLLREHDRSVPGKITERRFRNGIEIVAYESDIETGPVKVRFLGPIGEYKTIQLRGVDIPLEVFEHPEKIDIRDSILFESNATVRSIMLETVGHFRFMQEIPGKKIEEDGSSCLIRISWHENEEPLMLLRVQCPTTGVFYLLRVPPTMVTCKDALAWTFGMTKEEYFPVEET